MNRTNLVFGVLAGVLGLEFVVGNIRAAMAPLGVGAASKLAARYRWTGAGLSVVPVALLLLGAFLLRLLPDLVWYYLCFCVLALSVGTAQGCVHAAASWLKVDPVEHPFKAFNMGFGLQVGLLLVPVVNAAVLTFFTLWGFGGLALLALGYQAPDESLPAGNAGR